MFSSAGRPPAIARLPSAAMVQQQPQQQQSQHHGSAPSDRGGPNGHAQQQQQQQLPSSSSPDSANNNHHNHHHHFAKSATVGQNSPVINTTTASSTTAAPAAATALSTSPVVYGELIILGYNGSLPQGEKGRRRSKFQLVRRLAANGIKKSKHYSVKQPQTSQAILDKDRHSISFTLSRSQAIIVEYQHDEETDMFQIGRSSESPIDFVVIDTVMLDPNRSTSSSSQHRAFNGNGHHHHHHQQAHNSTSSSSSEHYLGTPSTTALAMAIGGGGGGGGHPFSSPPTTAPKTVQQSTISRFACRILVDRQPPYCARIYAAGFDSSKNIFLGEKATKWQANGEIDGLTTNGILIMHPKRPFVRRPSQTAAAEPQPPVNAAAERKKSSTDHLDHTNLLFDELDLNGGGGGQVRNGAQQPAATATHLGGVWREVSVCGEIYSVRETRSASQKGIRIEAETNVLQDGTLIDLCGATLMWRSAEGLRRSPTKRHLEEMVDELNASRPQCPVGLNTLVIPRRASSAGGGGGGGGALSQSLAASLAAGTIDEKQPYVYLNCGHVQGYHDWGHVKADGSSGKENGSGGGGGGGSGGGGGVNNSSSSFRTCPMCFKSGPVVRLTMGIEPSFWASSATPSYAFNPCGHMASETTTSYWSQVLIPHGTNGFHAMCPFCATPLGGETGYVKLIFQ